MPQAAENGVARGHSGILRRGRNGRGYCIFARQARNISGSIVAAAVKADLYENWTDVNGILNADPRIVKDADVIENMTYGELRELSYLGASIMHTDALSPLIKSKIPLNVRNTFCTENSGTMIYPSLKAADKNTVTGIIGKKDFVILLIHKIGMNLQKSTVRKILSVLEYYGIVFEHMPSKHRRGQFPDFQAIHGRGDDGGGHKGNKERNPAR